LQLPYRYLVIRPQHKIAPLFLLCTSFYTKGNFYDWRLIPKNFFAQIRKACYTGFTEGCPVTQLKYTLKTDTLFKILFTKYQELLKKLVAELLDIQYESIEEFVIINPDISPEELGKKFCRLDINMMINGQKVDLEVQVSDEGNYPERSLFYWARV